MNFDLWSNLLSFFFPSFQETEWKVFHAMPQRPAN
jgi:hypothetical protein